MNRAEKESAYHRAKQRVDKIRGFFNHLVIYIIVNIIISVSKVVRNLDNGETFQEAMYDLNTYIVWIFWGFGLLLHAFSVFGLPYLLGKNWEEEKIKKFMEEENRKIK